MTSKQQLKCFCKWFHLFICNRLPSITGFVYLYRRFEGINFKGDSFSSDKLEKENWVK